MAFQILLNVFLAFCWMFLSNSPSAAGFITGYILGMLSLFLPALFHSPVLSMEIDFYYQALFHFYKGTVPCQCQCDEISLISKTEYQTGYFCF